MTTAIKTQTHRMTVILRKWTPDGCYKPTDVVRAEEWKMVLMETMADVLTDARQQTSVLKVEAAAIPGLAKKPYAVVTLYTTGNGTPITMIWAVRDPETGKFKTETWQDKS